MPVPRQTRSLKELLRCAFFPHAVCSPVSSSWRTPHRPARGTWREARASLCGMRRWHICSRCAGSWAQTRSRCRPAPAPQCRRKAPSERGGSAGRSAPRGPACSVGAAPLPLPCARAARTSHTAPPSTPGNTRSCMGTEMVRRGGRPSRCTGALPRDPRMMLCSTLVG